MTIGQGTGFPIVELTGKFLIIPNSNSNNIQSFSIDQASGALTQVAGSPFTTDQVPLPLRPDPSYQVLLRPERHLEHHIVLFARFDDGRDNTNQQSADGYGPCLHRPRGTAVGRSLWVERGLRAPTGRCCDDAPSC